MIKVFLTQAFKTSNDGRIIEKKNLDLPQIVTEGKIIFVVNFIHC